jgi:hypothetical protein
MSKIEITGVLPCSKDGSQAGRVGLDEWKEIIRVESSGTMSNNAGWSRKRRVYDT